MYRTRSILKRKLRVRYPAGRGSIVLRTELDWQRDLEPESTSEDGSTFTFALEAAKPFLYFKACLRAKGFHWSAGPNMLVLMTSQGTRDVYPFFHEPDSGFFTETIEVASISTGGTQAVRVYLPPGYRENELKRFPALYMQDGRNLFFPRRRFSARTGRWTGRSSC
jgi:hypothetical protein